MASIHVIQGPDKGRSFELTESENIIGRRGNPVRLVDNTVSRSHALMARHNGQWSIEDMGSANSTYVNGVRLQEPLDLKAGDQVRCGATLFVFADDEDPAPGDVDVDEVGNMVDAAIIATVPSNEDSVVMPSPETGAEAIGSLRILYDLMADAGSVFNTDMLLRQTLDKVFDVIKADRGYIMLINDNGELALKAARVGPEKSPKDAPISRTIINEVVSKQVGILSNNVTADQRFASGKSVHDMGIRSAICVPIKGRSRVLGVIHVDCNVSGHTYTTNELRLLTAVGFQTGMAIDNIELHQSAVQSERLAAIGETVAFLSHNIKNILQALDAGVDVVEMAINRGDLDSAKSSWPIVQRSLSRINGLILNMLAFSKDREPLLEPINVSHILTECIESNSARADEHGIAIMSDLDDVPPIAADAEGLNQAFLNLISNAIDAVEDKIGIVTVTSKYDADKHNVVVSVLDNGLGIEKDDLSNIFTPFYSTKGHKGTGLGLAVTKKVILEHHGRISIASKLGEGTTFTVTLPASQSDAQQSAAETNMPAQ
ncbi:MAG: FHA domain-containing protein [Planctomycetes bacterium]|nr:FHA domain-containing protein [Planctomycetota bacterium]